MTTNDIDNKNQPKQEVEKKQPPVFDDDFGPDHVWQDDGTTSFADMDLTRPVHQQKRTQKQEFDLSRKERRAIRRAVWEQYLPVLLCAVFGFTAAMLLIMLWLS